MFSQHQSFCIIHRHHILDPWHVSNGIRKQLIAPLGDLWSRSRWVWLRLPIHFYISKSLNRQLDKVTLCTSALTFMLYDFTGKADDVFQECIISMSFLHFIFERIVWSIQWLHVVFTRQTPVCVISVSAHIQRTKLNKFPTSKFFPSFSSLAVF